MKFLCLAYGAEADWRALSADEQAALLGQDDVLRERGDLVAAVESAATTVRAPHGDPHVTPQAFAESRLPLAGFSIIEAANIEEAVRLVAGTPCARAGGAVELRAISAINDP